MNNLVFTLPNFTKDMTTKFETLWARFGDASDYVQLSELSDFCHELREICDPLDASNDGRTGTLFRWVHYGLVVSPGFTGQNYVSIFWGDADAQPTRELNRAERKQVENTLSLQTV